MLKFSWIVTLVVTCLAAVGLVLGLSKANGAPQEASVAAIALCCVVIPYIFTRAIEGLSANRSAKSSPSLADIAAQQTAAAQARASGRTDPTVS